VRDAQIELDVLARRHIQRAVERHAALATDGLAGQFILPLPVEIVVAGGETSRDPVGHAAADATRQGALVRIEGTADVGLHLVVRPTGDEVDGARVGVAAIERTLRAADDFDPLHLAHVECLDVAGVVHAVNEISDAGFDGGVGAREHAGEATHHRTLIGTTEGLREHEARGELRNIVERIHLTIADVLGGEGGHRERHFLQGLFALAGRDDHFLQSGTALGTGRGGLSESGMSAKSRSHGHGNEQRTRRNPSDHLVTLRRGGRMRHAWRNPRPSAAKKARGAPYGVAEAQHATGHRSFVGVRTDRVTAR